MTWSTVTRPATLAEIAGVFSVPPRKLDRLARRHGIAPALTIGRLRLYGAAEVRELHALLRAEEGDGEPARPRYVHCGPAA